MTPPRRLPEHSSPRNITELHPEELFDKLARHALSAEESRVLSDHLERCAACRAEREAREHFQQALVADHGPLELALGGALGRIAEERAREPLVPPSVSPPTAPAPPRPTQSRRRRAGALVLGAMFLAGAAAALGGVAYGDREPTLALTGSDGTATSSAGVEQPHPAAHVPEAAAATSVSVPTSVRPPGATMPGAGLSAVRSGRAPGIAAPAVTSTPASSPAASSRQITSSRQRKSSPPVRPVAVGGASSLFRQANQARNHGKLERAEGLYVELIRRFPGARESAAARALLGQLALDHGSPEQALVAFDEYMRNSDSPPALSEEALVGRARALQALGDAKRERRAWSDLLQRFPKSAASGEARQRLQTLSRP